MDSLNEEIHEITSGLTGAEIQYKDYDYAIIEFIDGYDVLLHCENEDDEDADNITISLDELLEVIRS